MIAKGEFEIAMEPAECSISSSENTFARLLLKKTFRGDLVGKSSGEMLSCRTNTEGSAGYIAIEEFVGELSGKSGGFSLQHFGTMQGGNFRLEVEVIPDSGFAGLKTISGKMQIIIEGGKHFYEFDYTL